MDANNSPAAEIPGEVIGTDWRSRLQQESRQENAYKIMEMLKRRPLLCGEEGLQELKKMCDRCEEEIYSAATSQSDYLRQISFRIWTIQKLMANPLQSNAASNSKNHQKPDSSSQVAGEDWQEKIREELKYYSPEQLLVSYQQRLIETQQGLIETQQALIQSYEQQLIEEQQHQQELRRLYKQLLIEEQQQQQRLKQCLLNQWQQTRQRQSWQLRVQSVTTFLGFCLLLLMMLLWVIQ